jgi:ABC-type amino acid transport substrate-binding protein
MMMVEYRQIDFAMDAYFDLERSKRFDYSMHYRTSTPQVFFRRENPITVADVSDLKKLKGCGLVGWSYVHYGLSKESLDMGVGLANMVAKLKARRCDFFLEELETIYSNKLVGDDYLTDPVIAHLPVPWAKAPTSHLMASKNSEASALIPAIDRALTGLIKSGTAAAIWKKHARELPFRP